jgi:hypothetical protein
VFLSYRAYTSSNFPTNSKMLEEKYPDDFRDIVERVFEEEELEFIGSIDECYYSSLEDEDQNTICKKVSRRLKKLSILIPSDSLDAILQESDVVFALSDSDVYAIRGTGLNRVVDLIHEEYSVKI